MPKSKKQRLIDVIGEMKRPNDWIIKKFKKLEISIKLHSTWSSPEGEAKVDVDWVENKIGEFDGGVVPNKDELDYANTLWKKYR